MSKSAIIIHWACEAPRYTHYEDGISDGGYCSTYREAKKLALAHFKKYGHATRAEKIITDLFI